MTAEDIDDVAVQRACHGDRSVPLTRDEMAEAVRQLEARGMSSREIGETLDVTRRSVIRWRRGEARPAGRPGWGQGEPIAPDEEPVRKVTVEQVRENKMLVSEVAPLLRVSKMTVYRLCESGELRSYRMGRSYRIPVSAVREYLAAAEVWS